MHWVYAMTELWSLSYLKRKSIKHSDYPYSAKSEELKEKSVSESEFEESIAETTTRNENVSSRSNA